MLWRPAHLCLIAAQEISLQCAASRNLKAKIAFEIAAIMTIRRLECNGNWSTRRLSLTTWLWDCSASTGLECIGRNRQMQPLFINTVVALHVFVFEQK